MQRQKAKEAPPKSRIVGGGGRSKGTAPARHVLSGSQWPPLSPPRGRGGAPSWRHQDNGRCRRRVTLGCGRACGSSAMVSLGPSQPGRLALPRPGWVAGRPPSGLGRAAPGSQRGRAAACGAPGQGRTWADPREGDPLESRSARPLPRAAFSPLSAWLGPPTGRSPDSVTLFGPGEPRKSLREGVVRKK